MNKKNFASMIGCCLGLLSVAAVAACNDSGGSNGDLDAGTLPDGATKDCFDNPKTHFEIINACTNATRIEKNPTLPKLLPDGGLPPLE